MGIYLERAIFKNIAPFGDLDFTFKENDVIVFSGINGQGKTTILSYIADAFFEMARTAKFQDVFEDASKYYRVSSRVTALNPTVATLVYLRFNYENDPIDYLEITGNLTVREYQETTAGLKNPMSSPKQTESHPKHINIGKKLAEEIFNRNILTYFPSDRSEIPSWLNISKEKYEFSTRTRRMHHLNKNIECRHISNSLINWVLDVILDFQVNKQSRSCSSVYTYASEIYKALNNILKKIFSNENSHLGVMPRNHGDTRLGIYRNNEKEIHAPSVSSLSAGQMAVFILFAELIKQYDAYHNDNSGFGVEKIKGIVLIDEIDKHLHIQLQKEVLPELIALFPNVQFIVSSHSPFFALGISESSLKDRIQFRELPTGEKIPPNRYDEVRVAYQALMQTTWHQEELEKITKKIQSGTKPLIITEGKTDWMHLKYAKTKLSYFQNMDIDFNQIKEDMGDEELLKLCERIAKYKLSPERKIIAIFDRDNEKIIGKIGDFKDFGNNVFAFCIPIPDDREKYMNISIEFYYSDEEIKKEYLGARLYFSNEITQTFGKGKRPFKIQEPDTELETQKVIFDQDVTDVKTLGSQLKLHSKWRFAELVTGQIQQAKDFSKDFNFDNFKLIFAEVSKIINNDSSADSTD